MLHKYIDFYEADDDSELSTEDVLLSDDETLESEELTLSLEALDDVCSCEEETDDDSEEALLETTPSLCTTSGVYFSGSTNVGGDVLAS